MAVHHRIQRRTLLRGAAGAAVALPFLECMMKGRSRADSPGTPCRYAILFAGQSLGGDGYAPDQSRVAGASRTETGHFIKPTSTGAGYALTTPLQPLAALRDDFSIVSGMRIPYSTSSADSSQVPPGGAFRGFHGGVASPLLSGTRSTSESYTANGTSSDQVMAGLHRGMTRTASLVLRSQPAFYVAGYGFSGREYISYAGPDDPIDAFVSPQVAFRMLFGGFMPPDTGGGPDPAAAALDYRQRSRRSVLDLIGTKRQRILGAVGVADRQRLERHFDELRVLEMSISTIPPMVTGQCVVPADPGSDPPIGGDNEGSDSGSITSGTGYSDEQARTRVMCDLIHMAFVCDLTRAATLEITTFQSHMNVLPITTALGTPVSADLHEVGHNGDSANRGQIPMSLCLQWHVAHYAYLLDKLRTTPEGGGNVLDNSAIIFMPEGGHGRQLNDGASENQSHSVENMVQLVAGRAGGLQPGRHIDAAGAHPAQCLISAMQATGYTGDTLGEVTGNISGLFG